MIRVIGKVSAIEKSASEMDVPEVIRAAARNAVVAYRQFVEDRR